MNIQFEGDFHICIQENRGEEVYMYCPVCKEYVRKFDKNLKPVKLVDTGFNHTGTISFDNQTNMN